MWRYCVLKSKEYLVFAAPGVRFLFLFFFCFPSALWEATVRSRANGIPFRGLFLKMLTKFPFARIPIFMALCLFFKLRFPFSTMNPSRNRAFTCFLTPHSKTVFILTFSLEKPKKKSSQVVCERQWNYMSVENCSHPPRFLNHSWTHPAAAHLHVSWHTARIKQTAPCNIPILPV